MKLRVALTGSLACALTLVGVTGSALAAPALELPWSEDALHRINEGDTYGCGYHTGSSYYAIDFEFSAGQDISAVAAGSVTEVSYSASLGNYVVIEHNADGFYGGFEYVSLYAHMQSHGTSVGAEVTQGEVIGDAGSTGWATGVHLHFLMRKDGAAYKAEPMSGVPKPGENGFGWYGYSQENGEGCGDNPNDPSPYWESKPARNGDVATFYDYGSGDARIHTWLSNGEDYRDYQTPTGWYASGSGYQLIYVGDRMVTGDYDGR